MTEFTEVRSPAQVAVVADLARGIWMEHYEPIIGMDQVNYMLESFQSETAIVDQISRGIEYYLAGHGGKAVGYLAVVPDVGGATLMISKIYVRKGSRRQGMGRKMLAFAEGICRERHISTLWLTVNRNNAATIQWYLRRGFVNSGPTLQDIGGGFVMDDYRMEKRLGPPPPAADSVLAPHER